MKAFKEETSTTYTFRNCRHVALLRPAGPSLHRNAGANRVQRYSHCFNRSGKKRHPRVLPAPLLTEAVESTLGALRVRVPYPPAGSYFGRFHVNRCRSRKRFHLLPSFIYDQYHTDHIAPRVFCTFKSLGERFFLRPCVERI